MSYTFSYTLDINNDATITGFATNPFNVTDIVIPSTIGSNSSVISVQNNAFENIPLTSVALPYTLQEMDPYCFKNCRLKSIAFPTSMKTVATEALAMNSTLMYATFKGDAPSYGIDVFKNTSNVRLVADPAASGFGFLNPMTNTFYTDTTFTTPQLWSGQVVYGDLNSSTICFIGSTPIVTDQGIFPVDKIDPAKYTIQGKPILAITRTIEKKNMYLVHIEKDALAPNLPTNPITMTENHLVWYQGKKMYASELVGQYDNVTLVPYKGEILYNIALDKHSFMKVNGLYIETMHPKNPLVKHFISHSKRRQKKRIPMYIA
jgi:hypothetical protein